MESNNLSEQIRLIVMRDFAGKIPSLKAMAAHLNMSTRSLQRQLQQKHCRYRSVSLKMKEEFAESLLSGTDTSVQSISDFLGYTESGSFVRAFKKQMRLRQGKKCTLVSDSAFSGQDSFTLVSSDFNVYK